MRDNFISAIHIDKVRHLKDIHIVLSKPEDDIKCKHLILTGKNGSGKTSLLDSLYDIIYSAQQQLQDKFLPNLNKGDETSRKIKNYLFHNGIITNPEVRIEFSNPIDIYENMIFVFISAKRNDITVPQSIEKNDSVPPELIGQNASQDFYKYLLNLDYQRNGAIADGNVALSEKLNQWFSRFKVSMCEIFDCESLSIYFERSKLRVEFEIPGRENFALNEMSDGYKAFLNIYMELIMRFSNESGQVDFDLSAIVLIDELESHLHVELQKRALPFLTRMFPNVQFIVATHSPFIITSLSNAVVFDLEKKETLENPSFYSYESVVESFLDTSAYSQVLKKYFERYKELCFKKRTPAENEEFLRAKTELELMSPALKELYLAFHNLESKRKASKNG
jgi:predicted ATPase